MKTKRDNFVNAAHRLAEAVTDYRNIRNDTVRDGMIQRFEFTFELGWKALKEYMLDAGMQNTLQFPKQVLREAYAAELIDDESVWLDMLNARNQTSHIYDDHTAAVIAAKIQNAYLPELQNLSVKRLFGRVAMGLVLSMSGITIALFLVTKQIAVLLTGGTLLLCALVGIFVLTQAFGKRLSQFTADLCQTLDHMIAGNEAPQRPEDSETQLARIGHRLARLYQIMQENRRRVDEERQELQTLVSDISHQVKTPVSNLKMATDTLLEKPMAEAERTDFIRGIRSQTDKLDFLFQALVKTSRLETGVIQLDKKPGRLFDTVAQAMSGIVYAAEKKEIVVSVDCPEDLTVFHDSKWTSEALFNLLDNAVKYTPAGGKIAVSVVLWEMYVEIKVTDTGKGISESNQAAIFQRFYREEEVHEQQGVGIGLYLAREIVTRQGGYIKVVSEPGKGSEFSIMLPLR